jgi:hypothetical protein
LALHLHYRRLLAAARQPVLLLRAARAGMQRSSSGSGRGDLALVALRAPWYNAVNMKWVAHS